MAQGLVNTIYIDSRCQIFNAWIIVHNAHS